MALADNATTRLGELTDLLQEEYFGEFIEQSWRHGRTTNRLFKPRDEPVVGDGETFQFETARGDTVRFSRSPLQDFAAPRAFQADKIKVRFSENSSSNDFSEISGSGQVSHLDLIEKGDGAIINAAERIYRQIREDFEDKLALHQHIDQTAKVADVNGTRKNNDSWYQGGASTYTTDSTSMRCQIDGGPIAAFKEGRLFDIYNSDALVINSVQVTDFNPDDNSVGFATTSATTAATDFDDVSDNHSFYLSGEKGKGMYGLAAWMTRPTANETFIGGVDRSDSDKRYMITTATREGSSSTAIAKSHFNDLAIAMGFVHEDEDMVAVMTDPELHQGLRDAIGEDAFIPWPLDNSRAERFANFGTIGLNWQHPVFGLVKILADPLCTPNRVYLTVPSDWLMLYYGYKGLQFMPGEIGGVWYRMESDTPGNGRSKFYKCDAYTPGVTCFCKRPKRQGRILNVTAN